MREGQSKSFCGMVRWFI